ncbi:MAG: serine--tRNA ligase [Phycisphaeraceae bacterium]
MIDLADLREHPDRYRQGVADKGGDPSRIDALLDADAKLRAVQTELQEMVAEKNRMGKEIGQLAGRLKKAGDVERPALQEQMKALQARPAAVKEREATLAEELKALEPRRLHLWLTVPQPAAADVPVGKGAQDNVELRTWKPDWFDPRRSFVQNKGFEPQSHIELMTALGMVDFEQGVKMAGSRSYVLLGDGMRLHSAVLRYAFDFMTQKHGFTAASVPVLVRDEVMVGTGFFPEGRDQAYEVKESDRGGGSDLYLTGTGEVGLMGLHMGELLDEGALPLRYTTLSTCFRREAGAAGKDTAGLYRIHQFDKVEQVVICKSDEAESRAWHQRMIGYVEELLQTLQMPYRLLQCCTGDLGPKNADMIDIETWMPSRGGRGAGAYGETHSASRLYDYQCRRLNLRYKDAKTGKNIVCHSLNNTVAASPRILIPIVEIYQNADGSITVPAALRPYMGGQERIR